MSETASFHIPAIDCEGCIESIRRIMERKGASLESGDPETQDVTIRYDPGSVSRDELVEALTDADFAPE